MHCQPAYTWCPAWGIVYVRMLWFGRPRFATSPIDRSIHVCDPYTNVIGILMMRSMSFTTTLGLKWADQMYEIRPITSSYLFDNQSIENKRGIEAVNAINKWPLCPAKRLRHVLEPIFATESESMNENN